MSRSRCRRYSTFCLTVTLIAAPQVARAGVWVAAGTDFGGVAENFAIDPARPSTLYANFGGFGHGGLGL
jgi:hypothetical protein